MPFSESPSLARHFIQLRAHSRIHNKTIEQRGALTNLLLCVMWSSGIWTHSQMEMQTRQKREIWCVRFTEIAQYKLLPNALNGLKCSHTTNKTTASTIWDTSIAQTSALQTIGEKMLQSMSIPNCLTHTQRINNWSYNVKKIVYSIEFALN